LNTAFCSAQFFQHRARPPHQTHPAPPRKPPADARKGAGCTRSLDKRRSTVGAGGGAPNDRVNSRGDEELQGIVGLSAPRGLYLPRAALRCDTIAPLCPACFASSRSGEKDRFVGSIILPPMAPARFCKYFFAYPSRLAIQGQALYEKRLSTRNGQRCQCDANKRAACPWTMPSAWSILVMARSKVRQCMPLGLTT
jgi:hypothetical protein